MNEIIKSHEGFGDILGVVQHHDAVSGTATQLATNDY